MNTAANISVIGKYKEGLSPTSDTTTASYDYECTPQEEEYNIRVVSDRINQDTEDTAISEEEGVQDNKFALSDDLENVVENARATDISEEASSMTAYHNRAERRSVQRVELREMRVQYKRDKKILRSKAEFYREAEDTSVECNTQDTTEAYAFVDILLLLSHTKKKASHLHLNGKEDVVHVLNFRTILNSLRDTGERPLLFSRRK